MKREETKISESLEAGSENAARKQKTEKDLADGIKKGKLEAAPSKDQKQQDENAFGSVAQKGKKGKKAKEQTTEIVYEDDSQL